MRKNKFMRAASGLLVAVLLTTCVISGTFAKYTTSAEGSDSARVATWGFKDDSSITLNDLFKDVYSDDNENVKGKDGANVIAPGSKNSATFAFKYTGQTTEPEVAYTFKVDTTDSDCAQDIKSNKNIQWKLDTEEWGTWDKMISDIKALSGDHTGEKTYQPGQIPDSFKDSTTTHTVQWRWAFDKDSKDAVDKTDQADKTDTALGNKSSLDNVTLKITITATQVD